MRQISTSKGWRSLRSVDCGLRPNSSETSLPAPTNFPLGEDQVTSAMSFVLIFRIGSLPIEDTVRKIITAYFTKKPLRVDANEGWTDKEEAVRKINWLEKMGVEFIEQPMPA